MDTKYCPADWLDEIAPVLVADPAEAVRAGGPTGWILLDDLANIDDEEELCRLPLIEGQIVGWCAYRDYGDVRVEVYDDGTHVELDDYPADTTHFAHEDADDDMADTMAECVARGNPEDCASPLPAGIHSIHVWHWSNEIPLRFEISEGKPRFVQCAGHQ